MHGLRTAHELPYRDQQQPTENSIGRKEKHHGPSLQQDDEPNADMLTACMVGDLSNMSPGYALEYFEDTHYYLIQIKPVSKAIQAYINQIQIYLDKKDMSVHKLRLSETATNYTEYEFSDKKFNSLNDEAKFTIR